MLEDESDYVVEQHIKPDKVSVPLINDERADILGNFDDANLRDDNKFQPLEGPFSYNPNEEQDDIDEAEDSGADNSEGEDAEINEGATDDATTTAPTSSESTGPKTLTDNQITNLLRGASKKDRFVLYVTNLSYQTSKEKLVDFFSSAGIVKSVRVPKTRKNAFAFIEMLDLEGFKNALTMHHHTLDSFKIKIQVSEGGKKKSANKKNILKQKNRKLAEMRNEVKQFTKSGKGYDKKIKREIKQKQMQQERRLAKKKNNKNKKP